MSSVHSSTAIIPFPVLPPSLADRLPSVRAGMRRFGIYESDLTIDFADGNTSALVTRILGQCTVDPNVIVPEGFFRELSVGKRLEFLLVLAAGEERPVFHFPFYCEGCGQELEMELTLEEVAEIQQKADTLENIGVEIGGQVFSFRKPCGGDQENWAGMVFHDEGEAVRTMIGTLVDDPDITKKLGTEDFDLIEEAMDEADPLVNFQCRIGCSECGAENELRIDLCDVALGMLNRLQRQSIVMVHKLASHYHWSEKEIFDVPHWRRKEYLDLIATGR